MFDLSAKLVFHGFITKVINSFIYEACQIATDFSFLAK